MSKSLANRLLGIDIVKGVLFRVLAVALSLTPLLIAEIVLRGVGWQPATEFNDPFIGLTGVQPLFVASGETYQTNPSRLEFFCPAQFPASKAVGEFRVFVLGGSTVQGRPYEPATAFPKWLELTLQFHDPSIHWRVINCGGVSYASYRLKPIFHELLDYEPDLIVLCTGHNEFLEDRTYAELKRSPAWVKSGHRFLSRYSVYQFLRWLWCDRRSGGANSQSATLTDRLITRLDYEHGLARFQRNADWQAAVEQHFEFSLRQMIAAAKHRQVPVILISPPSNWKDCPPFKSAFNPELPADESERLDALWLAVTEEAAERKTKLLEIQSIDPTHADANYQLGQICEQDADYRNASKYYRQAIDCDVCPLRMTENLAESMRQAAADSGAPLIELEEIFAAHSENRLPGAKWFLDHVHPNVQGHQLIAAVLFDQLVQQGFASRSPKTDEQLEELFQTHLQSLDFGYFQRGRDRLQSVLQWSRGQAINPLPN